MFPCRLPHSPLYLETGNGWNGGHGSQSMAKRKGVKTPISGILGVSPVI